MLNITGCSIGNFAVFILRSWFFCSSANCSFCISIWFFIFWLLSWIPFKRSSIFWSSRSRKSSLFSVITGVVSFTLIYNFSFILWSKLDWILLFLISKSFISVILRFNSAVILSICTISSSNSLESVSKPAIYLVFSFARLMYSLNNSSDLKQSSNSSVSVLILSSNFALSSLKFWCSWFCFSCLFFISLKVS